MGRRPFFRSGSRGRVLGSGCAYGYQNYLLNRDLDPAANDNSPVRVVRSI